MRIGMVAILVVASLAACGRRSEYLRNREAAGEAQIVALSVRSDPPGATVKVNRIERSWTTPCDIADFSIQRGSLDLNVSLSGYEPVVTRVAYDGQNPAVLQIKLRPSGRSAAPPAAETFSPAKAPEPAPEQKAETPAEKPAPVKIEAVAGGTRLKVVSLNAKIRIQAKTVVSEPDRPGEIFLPGVPPEKVVVDLLDPKSDAVIASVEFAPVAAPAVVKTPLPVPKDPVVVEADRVGEVKLVSKTYGVFVKLDPGLSLQPGEEIIVFRDGREVARTKILKVTRADDNYPDGAAQVQREGSIQKGDEVRRTKP